ncbi:MAG: hypothetical protein IT308_07620 [Anaerolineaceae bacterium]|nr:hypothetical protein [Anaerolineaceae bacterium]
MQGLLLSRKFWALILAVVVIVIAAFVPDFNLDAEHAAAFAVIIVSYIIGVSVDPGPGDWRGVLKSRKFYGAVFGLVLTFLDAFHLVLPFDLTVEQMVSIAVAVGGYIAGVAFEKPKNL